MGSIPTFATMAIVYKKGDVLNSGERVIVHGCNCFNTMGSGMAKQIKAQYPEAYKVDQITTKGDRGKLGRFSHAVIDDVIIVNAYTQYRYGRDKVYVDYDALKTVITRICMDIREGTIAMPKIGCGLAGGDWDIVSEILESVSNEYNRTFHVYLGGPEWVEEEPEVSPKFFDYSY